MFQYMVNFTTVLQAINDKIQYGTDMKFAKSLFNIPLPNRYQWLEELVDDSLRKKEHHLKLIMMLCFLRNA